MDRPIGLHSDDLRWVAMGPTVFGGEKSIGFTTRFAFGAVRFRLRSILGPLWVRFGSVLGPASLLVPFWDRFGSVLGP